jgi:hypothetical protein
MSMPLPFDVHVPVRTSLYRMTGCGAIGNVDIELTLQDPGDNLPGGSLISLCFSFRLF